METTNTRRVARALLPTPALRHHTRLLATRAVRTTARQKLHLLEKPIQLNLGASWHHAPGWTSIDLAGVGADIAWDLTKPIPLPDQSVQAIFTEHFLEHLPLEDGRRVIADAHRLLQPGGVLRVCVPDGATDDYDELNRIAYRWGHQAIYDEALLIRVFRDAGFTDPVRCGHRESVLASPPDDIGRPGLTVEAIR